MFIINISNTNLGTIDIVVAMAQLNPASFGTLETITIVYLATMFLFVYIWSSKLM